MGDVLDGDYNHCENCGRVINKKYLHCSKECAKSFNKASKKEIAELKEKSAPSVTTIVKDTSAGSEGHGDYFSAPTSEGLIFDEYFAGVLKRMCDDWSPLEVVCMREFSKETFKAGQASRNIRLPDAQTSFDEWCRIRNELGHRSDNYKHAIFHEWFTKKVIAMNKGEGK